MESKKKYPSGIRLAVLMASMGKGCLVLPLPGRTMEAISV